jgi:hypothetical protein
MPATKNRVLQLVSPNMVGDDIKHLQELLVQYHYLNGAIDGVYGPMTAQAVYRAKWWLGYPKNACTQTAESRGLLVQLLEGKKKPTPAMVKAAKARKAQVPIESIGAKMFKEALRWVGTKENPAGSNRVMFSQWYGVTGAWCAMFVTYCGVKVGSKAFNKPPTGQLDKGHYAYVPYIRDAARAGRDYLSITTKPVLGDLPLFDWQNDGVPDHVGIFEKWISPGVFASVEGNTSGDDSGSQSNGGMVAHRNVHPRYSKNVSMFVHIAG